MFKNLRILIVSLCVLFVPFGAIKAMEGKSVKNSKKICIKNKDEGKDKIFGILAEIKSKIIEIENNNFYNMDEFLESVRWLGQKISNLDDIENMIMDKKNKECVSEIEKRLEKLIAKIFEKFFDLLIKQDYKNTTFEELDTINEKRFSDFSELMNVFFKYCRKKNSGAFNLPEKQLKDKMCGLYWNWVIKVFEEKFAEVKKIEIGKCFDYKEDSLSVNQYLYDILKNVDVDVFIRDIRYLFDFLDDVEHDYKEFSYKFFLKELGNENDYKQRFDDFKKDFNKLIVVYIILVCEKCDINGDNVDKEEFRADVERCVNKFNFDDDKNKEFLEDNIFDDGGKDFTNGESLWLLCYRLRDFYIKFPYLSWSESAKQQFEDMGKVANFINNVSCGIF